jgi:hypothetical protein
LAKTAEKLLRKEREESILKENINRKTSFMFSFLFANFSE